MIAPIARFSRAPDLSQLNHIKDGDYWIEVWHPSYDEESASTTISIFPLEMLSRDKKEVIGYTIPYELLPYTFRNLKQQHESEEKLRALASLLSGYLEKHNNIYPEHISELEYDNINKLSTWIANNVEYLGHKTTSTNYDSQELVLAYDKALLGIANGTNVLFQDGHVEYCRMRRLRNLGIND